MARFCVSLPFPDLSPVAIPIGGRIGLLSIYGDDFGELSLGFDQVRENTAFFQ